MSPSDAPTLSAKPVAEFVAAVGGCYECSAWVAERAHACGPYSSLSALAAAMRATVDGASDGEKLALLKAHPDLAGKAAIAGDLTAESTEEQKRAGLGSLTAAEMARFTELNDGYKARFGFPFILAVRNANKGVILASFERRVHNSAAAEFTEALAQVHKIAWMRMREIVVSNPTGFLTCHVLDTARGCPAAGMELSLRRLDEASGAWELLGSFVTNDDGRLSSGPALKGGAMHPGKYEWLFCVGDYFAAQGAAYAPAGTPFLGEVPIRFGIDDPESHYHVPLLCSPFSFSTYRGS